MHWQDAVLASSQKVAWRRKDAERTVLRYADGHAEVHVGGSHYEAAWADIDGYLDWEPA